MPAGHATPDNPNAQTPLAPSEGSAVTEATLVIDAAGWLSGGRRVESPNADERPAGEAICLAVIHAISLPPDEFGGDDILRLFTNTLDPAAHPYFAGIAHLRVSSHFLIRRDGELIQFVATTRRAWHAGVSNWQGRSRCNDFSLGIELEGGDAHPFTDAQYAALRPLLRALAERHPVQALAGHSDIAPGRKTDPGPYFEWPRLVGTGIPPRQC
ncbi:1,6-anhydro-N-acetylmuramyl-L-alanine amidase AmpD [Rhodocyclus tenuis]|uniref:1,6-anhydro-N-acetylmuramyl-L-alanine amidase AmpD n=1 Tax=Rhodocyclus gracilis TaxID=2929842 RepID=UPI001298C84F|nr:1,6-anhydro-N-acetylmuramyl-L-alanine amidase AmpD [Rhodocyclus gracilis]MRD72634.1 1,6-anhydro-N-acetylmuramyl-L-alanine amidase AmpD [Rhodocyclus gracilis]